MYLQLAHMFTCYESASVYWDYNALHSDIHPPIHTPTYICHWHSVSPLQCQGIHNMWCNYDLIKIPNRNDTGVCPVLASCHRQNRINSKHVTLFPMPIETILNSSRVRVVYQKKWQLMLRHNHQNYCQTKVAARYKIVHPFNSRNGTVSSSQTQIWSHKKDILL